MAVGDAAVTELDGDLQDFRDRAEQVLENEATLEETLAMCGALHVAAMTLLVQAVRDLKAEPDA